MKEFMLILMLLVPLGTMAKEQEVKKECSTNVTTVHRDSNNVMIGIPLTPNWNSSSQINRNGFSVYPNFGTQRQSGTFQKSECR